MPLAKLQLPQSGAVLVMLIVFVPVLPKTPSEPPVSLKKDPPETVTRARIFSVRVLPRLRTFRLTPATLPPATLTSEPVFTFSVLALSLTSASPGTRVAERRARQAQRDRKSTRLNS